MAPARTGRDHRCVCRLDAQGAPSPCRFALPRLAPFQGRSTDDPEGRPLVAPRRHRIIGAKIQKILHRREIRRRGSGKKMVLVDAAEYAALKRRLAEVSDALEKISRGDAAYRQGRTKTVSSLAELRR